MQLQTVPIHFMVFTAFLGSHARESVQEPVAPHMLCMNTCKQTLSEMTWSSWGLGA